MADLPIEDPFSLAYDRVYFLFTNHQPFVDQFRERNLIRYDNAKRHPMKDGHEAADLPECQLRPNGFLPSLTATSSTTKVTCRFVAWMTTGNWQVEVMNKIAYETIRAMAKWKAVIGGTQWKGEPVIKDVRIVDVTTGETVISDQEREAMDGWSSEFAIEVDMIFNTANFLS